MDKDYIQRLKDMLADANKKIADTDNIQDPTERDFKKSMFVNSKKEIEALLKQAQGDTKKPAAKKEATTKFESKKSSKPVAKKTEPKKEATVKVAKEVKKPKAKPVHKKSETRNVFKSIFVPTQEEKDLKVLRKEAAEKASEHEKRYKETEKEYKQNSKFAAKEFKKPMKIDGFLIPEYSDEVAQVRSLVVPEFGSKKKSFNGVELSLNTMYASVFETLDEDAKTENKKISVKSYADTENPLKISEYKDTKKTPIAKVGVEAGPLENGFVPVDGPVKEKSKWQKAKEEKKAKQEAAKQEKLAAIAAKKSADKSTSKEQKKLDKEARSLAKEQEREALERETEMKRKQEEDTLRNAKAQADKRAREHEAEVAKQNEKANEINRLAKEASEKAAKQEKAEMKKVEVAEEKAEKAEAKASKESAKAKAASLSADEEKRIAEQSAKRAQIQKGEFIKIDLPPIPDDGIKSLKAIAKRQKQLTSKYSKQILDGAIVTTTDYKPDVSKHVIELHDVVKSYITGDVETPVLKGVNLTLNKGDFIVILGPSGSGKTTFLNTISGLDKATKGDVFVLGYNLSYLKDSHLTKFRRKHVGFIFQQYNLLTNLTAKENAEVGENLASSKNADMTIEDIFETIGMKNQMDKYPHQMSGGQQQRVSIARALAKNPDILFADEPTGALDEEMGRKVLEILVEVNKRYGTTVIVVTHNPNIAKIGNTVIHIRNGRVDEVEKNQKPEDPSTIEWA